MFEQTFKNIDDILWKDAGCSTELDYAEQSSWILFLKWLDDYEKDKETKAKLDNKKFKPVLDKEFQWSSWAVVKKKDGKVDFNKILTGPDLKKFVDNKLFPYLSKFRNKAESFNTLEYKIGEIFSELRNKLQDGYTLRGVIDEVDNLQFRSNKQKHELSALYEEKIKNMGNAGRNGGEYYTPRPLIKSIIKVINPKVGETVYDGAVGSAGFLIEAYEHMSNSKSLTTSELKTLQNKTLRYPGHWSEMIAYRQLGLFDESKIKFNGTDISPREFYHHMLEPKLLNDCEDVCLMRVHTEGLNKERPSVTKIDIKEKYDQETGFLAMEKWTGWHASIVMIEILNNNIDNGAIPIEKALSGMVFHKRALERSYDIKISQK